MSLLAMAVWIFPAAVYFGLLGVGMAAVAVGQSVLLAVAALIWSSWLKGAGRSFEEGGESMRSRLTKE